MVYQSHKKIAYGAMGLSCLRSAALNTGVTTGDAIGDGTALDWGGWSMQPGALSKSHGRCLVKREISVDQRKEDTYRTGALQACVERIDVSQAADGVKRPSDGSCKAG